MNLLALVLVELVRYDEAEKLYVQATALVDKSGKQSDCAMPRIVVRHCACAFGRQRKPELRAFERLALAFLIAAQHQCLLGRVQIEPDHVPELLFKPLVV